MFKRILAPIDGSGLAMEALDRAAELAKAFDATVTVVYVVDPYPFTGVGSEFSYGQDQYLETARSEGHLATEAATNRLKAAGVDVDARVVESHTIWRGIVDTVAEVGADLVVMSSHGRSGLERLVLGSVTQQVLARTKVSTLVVRATDANT